MDFDSPLTRLPPQLNDYVFNPTEKSAMLSQSRERNMLKIGSPAKNIFNEEKYIFLSTEALLRRRIKKLCSDTVSKANGKCQYTVTTLLVVGGNRETSAY